MTSTKITKEELQKQVTEHIEAALTEDEHMAADPHEQAMSDFADFLMKGMETAEAYVGAQGLTDRQRDAAAGRYDAYRKCAEMFQQLFS